MFCTQCGKQLKDDARFCHSCGAPADGGGESPKQDASSKESWLNSFGPFLFIPIFAAIVVVLFWANREPEPLTASANNSNQSQEAPSMAAMEQIHQTLERLKTRVEADPKDLIAVDSLAVMYFIAGSFDKARQYYEMHLDVEPDNLDVKAALGLIYLNLNDSEKAVNILESSLVQDPNHAVTLLYMGQVQDSQHNHDAAKEYWQKVVDLYPNTELAQIANARIQEQHSE